MIIDQWSQSVKLLIWSSVILIRSTITDYWTTWATPHHHRTSSSWLDPSRKRGRETWCTMRWYCSWLIQREWGWRKEVSIESFTGALDLLHLIPLPVVPLWDGWRAARSSGDCWVVHLTSCCCAADRMKLFTKRVSTTFPSRALLCVFFSICNGATIDECQTIGRGLDCTSGIKKSRGIFWYDPDKFTTFSNIVVGKVATEEFKSHHSGWIV